MNERNDKMKKDEFKVNIFFDEEGPSAEEIIMEAFEEKIIEIIEKYSNKNTSSLSNTDENNKEKVGN